MNAMNKPVVVGIADKQPTAVLFALREAIRAGTTLRVVHAARVPLASMDFYGVGSTDVDAGQKSLDDARHLIDQEVASPPVEYVLTTATPIEALERESTRARLLVVGADDIPWNDRVLRDAVARHIASSAACPVVVVPELAYPSQPSGGVVVALDGDTPASGPLKFAFEQAESKGRLLLVLHATPPNTSTVNMQALRANLGEVLAGWSDVYPDIRVTTSFVFDTAERAVVQATAHADLVVLGRQHSRAGNPFARPLAMRVLRRAHCPVAVIPAEYQGV